MTLRSFFRIVTLVSGVNLVVEQGWTGVIGGALLGLYVYLSTPEEEGHAL